MQLERLVKWKGEKVLHVLDQGRLGKFKVRAPHSYERLGVDKGN